MGTIESGEIFLEGDSGAAAEEAWFYRSVMVLRTGTWWSSGSTCDIREFRGVQWNIPSLAAVSRAVVRVLVVALIARSAGTYRLSVGRWSP